MNKGSKRRSTMSLGEWFRFVFSRKEFQEKIDNIIIGAFTSDVACTQARVSYKRKMKDIKKGTLIAK